MEATQSELIRASSVLYSRLSAGPLVVYEGEATDPVPDPTDPTGQREIPLAYPFIAFDTTPMSDRQTKMSLVWTRYESVVRVVGWGSLGALDEHLRFVHQALGGDAGFSQGGVTGRRINTFHPPNLYENGSNIPLVQAGYRYEVRVS